MPVIVGALGSILLFIFVSKVLILVVNWPFRLGHYISEQRGGTEAQAFMLGAFFESIYIGAFLALLVAERSRRRGEPKVNLWKMWGTFIGTIVVVTWVAYAFPGSPT